MAGWQMGGGGQSFAPPVGRGFRGDRAPGSGRRWGAVVLLIAAAVASCASLALPWWGLTVSASGGPGITGATLDFAPGTSPTCTYQLFSGITEACGAATSTYTSEGLGGLGDYYILAQVSALLAIVLGAIAALFAVQGAMHRFWGRWQFHSTHLMALASFVLLLLAPAAVMAVQPSLMGSVDYSTDQGNLLEGAINYCGTNTPNSTFWNSCTYTEGGISYTDNWGAGLGWYLAFVAAALFVGAGILLLSTQDDVDDDLDDGRIPRPVRAMRGGPSPRYGAPGEGFAGGETPLEGPYVGSPLSARSPQACPRCRQVNPGGAALCSRCHTPLS
jgi:hypothetical protein